MLAGAILTESVFAWPRLASGWWRRSIARLSGGAGGICVGDHYHRRQPASRCLYGVIKSPSAINHEQTEFQTLAQTATSMGIGYGTSAPPHPLREIVGLFRQTGGAVIGLVGRFVLLLHFWPMWWPTCGGPKQFRDATLVRRLWRTRQQQVHFRYDPVGRDILSRLIYGTRLS